MSDIQTKIELAKKQAGDALASHLKKIEHEDAIRKLAPDYDAPKWVSHTKHDDVDTLRYEVDSAKDVATIIEQYRAMYGAFMPIGKYVTSCCVVTAYPWKEYLEPSTLKYIEDDAVEARNSKGRGFSSVEFSFYPKIEGHRIQVRISLAFGKYIQGFEGYINAHYDKHGDPTTVEKRPPAAYKAAAYTVNFGGGSRDAADWRAVFNVDAFLTALGVDHV